MRASIQSIRRAGLISGTIATAILSAFIITGCGGSDNPSGGGGGCNFPSVPSAVSVPLSQSSIRISWTQIEAASFYNVYRAGSPSEEYMLLGPIFGTTFTDTGLVSGATYYYGISAENNCGEGAMSSTISETTLSCQKATVPMSVSAEPLSTTSIKIAWEAVPGDGVSYNIYRSTSQNGTYSDSIANTPSNSFTHAGLLPATTHYYKVAAVNNCGKSEMSNYASAITNSCPASAAPANVVAETKSSTSIEISWDMVNTAVSYQIYRSTSATGTYSPVGITTGKESTSYIDENLPTAETFYYRVTALSDCEESAQSNYAFASSGCSLIPAPPTGITAEALSSTEIKISWNAVSGLNNLGYYNIYSSETPNGNYRYRVRTTSTFTSMNITAHEPSTTYYFKISAENNCGESELSASYASATTEDCDLPIPPAPTGITASTLFSRSVDITWNAADGAATYDVYRSTERNSTFWTVSGGRSLTGNSFTDTTVSASTTYYYAVKSINACGGTAENLGGNIVDVTTLCETSVPTNVAVTPRSSSSLYVSWDVINSAVSYSVYRSSTVTGTYTLLGKVATNSFTDTGLTSLKTYFYKVTAKTELCDDSQQSAYGNGTTQ